MYNHEISKRQLSAWSVGAIAAPLAQLAGGAACTTVLLTGIITGIFLFAVEKVGRRMISVPNWLGYIAVVWITVKLIYLLRLAENCWQADNSRFFVPIVLLALAAWSAAKGKGQAAKVAAILFFFTIVGYGIVGAASLGDLKLGWVIGGTTKFQIQYAVIFLLPLVLLFLPTKEKVITSNWVIVISGIGALFTAMVNGILSPGIGGSQTNGFYELSRSIQLFGVLQRFEVLVAAIMVMGWFMMLSLYMSAIDSVVEEKGKRLTIWGVAAVAGAAYMIGTEISEYWVLAADFILSMLVMIAPLTQSKKN